MFFRNKITVKVSVPGGHSWRVVVKIPKPLPQTPDREEKTQEVLRVLADKALAWCFSREEVFRVPDPDDDF